MTDKMNDGQKPCCDGDCCQGSEGSSSKKRGGWKTLTFAAVLLLAGGVAAYSLFWKGGTAASSSCCPAGSAGCSTPCPTTTAIAGYDEYLDGADLGLAVFLTDGGALTATAAQAIDEVRSELEKRGSHVQMVYLTPTDSAFSKAADRYKIASFPALVVIANGSSQVLAQQDISRNSIVDIYDKAQGWGGARSVSFGEQTK